MIKAAVHWSIKIIIAVVGAAIAIISAWKGDDDGIVMVFDSSDTELASGNKFGISLKK